MPQSLAQIYLHLIWSTKHRTPWLKDRALRQRHSSGCQTALRRDKPAGGEIVRRKLEIRMSPDEQFAAAELASAERRL